MGWGSDITIGELARLIATSVGYPGELRFDPSRPDGTPRKLLDVSKLTALGWRPRIALSDGVAATCEWYAAHHQAELKTLSFGSSGWAYSAAPGAGVWPP